MWFAACCTSHLTFVESVPYEAEAGGTVCQGRKGGRGRRFVGRLGSAQTATGVELTSEP